MKGITFLILASIRTSQGQYPAACALYHYSCKSQWVFMGTSMQKLSLNIYFHECHFSLCCFMFQLSQSLSSSWSLLHLLPQHGQREAEAVPVRKADNTFITRQVGSLLHPTSTPIWSCQHKESCGGWAAHVPWPHATGQGRPLRHCFPGVGQMRRALSVQRYWRNQLCRGFSWRRMTQLYLHTNSSSS